MIGPNRRAVLRGGVGTAAFAAAVPAPALLAQAKLPFAGTTINASCFQTTYFDI